VLGNAGTLTVELVVLGAGKLLGALGAVVALGGAACAEGGSGALGAQSHARGGAGEHALSEHDGGRVEIRGCGGQLAGGGGFDEDARSN
jgi:hypothetical protein